MEDQTQARMRYTRGRRGPESRTRFTIIEATFGEACGGMARGRATAHLKKGDREVGFLVQGRNMTALREHLRPDGEFVAKARWTAREAVTFTGPALEEAAA